MLPEGVLSIAIRADFRQRQKKRKKSGIDQPFLFLLQDSLYGFPRLFTVTSEHIRLFTF